MFWEVNAYLRQVERKGNPPMVQPNNRQLAFPSLELVDNPAFNSTAQIFYERRSGGIFPARARFLGGNRLPRDTDGNPVSGLARREELANRVIEHENFPRAIVNRLWAHFFGRGFSQPFDDFNDQNTISHPELLDELAAKYKHYAYDQKMLIRWICNSKLYNLTCRTNPTNDKPDAEPYFSRMLLKVLSPEELFESLTTATTPDAAAADAAARREQREAWLNNLITNFGDDEGNEVNFNGTVLQALMMMNGPELNQAVLRKDGTVAQVMKRRGNNPRAIITDLYVVALNRPPTDREIQSITSAFPLNRAVREREDMARYADLFWALLNSNEFILNH
jgi:hypothetical protein